MAKYDKKCNISLILFSQVVQKQIMGVVENQTSIWLQVVPEILVSKIIKIFFKLQSKMSRMFFPDTVF